MARPEVFDTTVLIRLAHTGRGFPELGRRITSGSLWLSSVAAAEFFAGTRSAEDARLFGQFVTVMGRVGRMLTPTQDDWIATGRLLSRRVRLHGPLQPRDHLADVLIVVSAARIGGTVITANLRHFEPWAALARRARLDVRIAPDDISTMGDPTG
jgi:predicted nucleic acid-binding protein